jgi:thioredoxin-like negative regulator of GroEL
VQNGDVQKGMNFLQEALARAPHLSEVRYHMAFALDAAGRKEEAREQLDRIQRTDKAFIETREYRSLRERLD